MAASTPCANSAGAPNSKLKTTNIGMDRDCFAAIFKLLLVRSASVL